MDRYALICSGIPNFGGDIPWFTMGFTVLAKIFPVLKGYSRICRDIYWFEGLFLDVEGYSLYRKGYSLICMGIPYFAWAFPTLQGYSLLWMGISYFWRCNSWIFLSTEDIYLWIIGLSKVYWTVFGGWYIFSLNHFIKIKHSGR